MISSQLDADKAARRNGGLFLKRKRSWSGSGGFCDRLFRRFIISLKGFCCPQFFYSSLDIFNDTPALVRKEPMLEAPLRKTYAKAQELQ